MRAFWFLILVSAAVVQAQNCATGPRFINSNTLSALNSTSVVAFGREGDLPYFTSTLSRFAPYRASLPAVNGNQLLEGCFAVNPPLVAPPASYQSGAGSQRATVIHSSDNSNVGLAMLFFGQQRTLKVWTLNPDLSISGPQTYSFGQNLYGVLAADFNGDGKPDLAVVGQADQTTSAVWVLLNNGDATFRTPVPYSVPGEAMSVAAGDFNGDGKLDLAVGSDASNATSSVVTFFGNADGSFRTGATYATGKTVTSLSAADTDGDGIADLVIADADGKAVGRLIGNHDGTFRAYSVLATGGFPNYIAVGDFNNDGRADLAWTDFARGTLSVALNSGGGAFGAPQVYAGPEAISLIVTDVNQDGHADLVVGVGTPEAIGPDVDSEQITVFMNNGDGTFQGAPLYSFASTTQQLVVADFDGDGKLDVAGGAPPLASFSVQYGAGAGKFGTPSNFPVDPSATGVTRIATADFDGDGKADLLLGSQFGTAFTVALSKPGRTFQTTATTVGNGVQAVAAGDFNGDHHADAVIALGPAFNQSTTPQGIKLFPGDGHGGFGAPVTTGGLTASGLTPADLDKDGKLDLVVAISPVHPSGGDTIYSGLTILKGKGDGSFTTGQTLFAAFAVEGVAVADVNGDGIPDLIATLYAGQGYSVGVALGNGDATFKTPSMLHTDTGAQYIDVADLDGDGKPDLAVAHCCGSTTLTYFLGNGDGTFQAEKILAGESYDVHAADLNGDGKPDLVFSASSSSNIEVLLSFPSPQGVIANVNGASFLDGPLSAESIASAFGSGLATDSVIPGVLPLPTNVKDTIVTVTDSAGTSRKAPLFYVSNLQVNYEVPPGTANGLAQVTITSPLGTSSGYVQIENVSPAFFEANATLGLPVASTDLVTPDLTQTFGGVIQLDSSNNVIASPINMGNPGDSVYITLYATGVRNNGGLGNVSATIGGLPAQVLYAGTQSTFVGLDQVNLLIPAALKGKGQVDVLLTVDGVQAPPVVIVIQ